MDIYASDEEKGEAIKQWWRDNGFTVALLCLIGLSALFGGRYWTAKQQANAETASLAYQSVLNSISESDVTTAEDATTKLLSDFASTPYAVFAALEMAKFSAEQDNIASAKVFLQWVIDNASLSGQIDIARYRLAQILFDQKDYENALALTEQSEAQAFASLYAELRGDIYKAQDDKSQARAAYQSALLALAQGEPRQQLLMLKLDDVAGSNEG